VIARADVNALRGNVGETHAAQPEVRVDRTDAIANIASIMNRRRVTRESFASRGIVGRPD
jgi:hypothetical protein